MTIVLSQGPLEPLHNARRSLDYIWPNSPPYNKSSCNSRWQRYRVTFHSSRDDGNLIPLRSELSFMQPLKCTPTSLPSCSQAAISLPARTDAVVERVTAGAAPWTFPGEHPGWDEHGGTVEAAAAKMKCTGKHTCDGPSRNSFPHQVSSQDKQRSGDPLNSTCHCNWLMYKKGEWYVEFYLKINQVIMGTLCQGMCIC